MLQHIIGWHEFEHLASNKLRPGPNNNSILGAIPSFILNFNSELPVKCQNFHFFGLIIIFLDNDSILSCSQ